MGIHSLGRLLLFDSSRQHHDTKTDGRLLVLDGQQVGGG
jgi:hypothetical protein